MAPSQTIIAYLIVGIVVVVVVVGIVAVVVEIDTSTNTNEKSSRNKLWYTSRWRRACCVFDSLVCVDPWSCPGCRLLHMRRLNAFNANVAN
jgi:hypothetical protein